MMQVTQRQLLWLLVLLLIGCESFGIPRAETFNQRVLAGISTVTEVRKASTTLLEAKKISPDDHENIEKQADNLRAGLLIARTLDKTNSKAAEAKLESVRVALTALKAYLASKENP